MASGFAGEVIFFLIGAVAIGAAVERAGLPPAPRAFSSRSARGSPARLYVQMIAGFPVLALLIPSAITRNAVLIPPTATRWAPWASTQKAVPGAP